MQCDTLRHSLLDQYVLENKHARYWLGSIFRHLIDFNDNLSGDFFNIFHTQHHCIGNNMYSEIILKIPQRTASLCRIHCRIYCSICALSANN